MPLHTVSQFHYLKWDKTSRHPTKPPDAWAKPALVSFTWEIEFTNICPSSQKHHDPPITCNANLSPSEMDKEWVSLNDAITCLSWVPCQWEVFSWSWHLDQSRGEDSWSLLLNTRLHPLGQRVTYSLWMSVLHSMERIHTQSHVPACKSCDGSIPSTPSTTQWFQKIQKWINREGWWREKVTVSCCFWQSSAKMKWKGLW